MNKTANVLSAVLENDKKEQQGEVKMNMIEKVAEAIAEARNEEYFPNIDNPCAKAAIEAMREPTEGMIEVGKCFSEDIMNVEDSYKAMIDAALKEE